MAKRVIALEMRQELLTLGSDRATLQRFRLLVLTIHFWHALIVAKAGKLPFFNGVCQTYFIMAKRKASTSSLRVTFFSEKYEARSSLYPPVYCGKTTILFAEASG